MVKVRIQEEKHVELLKAGKQAKHRLEELAPEIRLKGKGNYVFFSLIFFHVTLWVKDDLKHNTKRTPKYQFYTEFSEYWWIC